MSAWIQWTGIMEWNGMLISWILLIGFHLLIMTTSKQRPRINKNHPNYDWIAISAVNVVNSLPRKDLFIKTIQFCGFDLKVKC